MSVSERTERALDRYADMIWHICLMRTQQPSDAQDAFQDTFVKHLTYSKPFDDANHEKAWLIRVAINTCNDQHKRAYQSDTELTDVIRVSTLDQPGNELSEVLDAMMSLSTDQRTALYLSAVQGYSASEIADYMNTATGTVYSWISRAREQLKEALK